MARFAAEFESASGRTALVGPELEAKLHDLYTTARASWPRLEIAEDAFVAFLAQKSKHADANVETLHASDLYLACGLCDADSVAIQYFEETLVARVPQFVARTTVSRDVVDEVKQALREKLLVRKGDDEVSKIAEYTGKGALGGWLRVAAVRTALNLVRRSQSTSAASEPAEDEPSLALDPELAFLKERSRSLFQEVFVRVLSNLDVEARNLLRLHYIQGLTMDQLSSMFGVPRSTVARHVASARERILSETSDILRDEHRLSASSVASVLRQARSQLQVTMTKFLK